MRPWRDGPKPLNSLGFKYTPFGAVKRTNKRGLKTLVFGVWFVGTVAVLPVLDGLGSVRNAPQQTRAIEEAGTVTFFTHYAETVCGAEVEKETWAIGEEIRKQDPAAFNRGAMLALESASAWTAEESKYFCDRIRGVVQ